MKLVRPRPRCQDHLSSGSRSRIRSRQSRVDFELLDCRCWNDDPKRGFLTLVRNAAGIDTIERKVVVVTTVPGKPNAPLIGGSWIDGTRNHWQQRGPVPPVLFVS